MTDKLSHLDSSGAARMVDVSGKATTVRTATAEGWVLMAASTLAALQYNAGPKGEVLSVARIAGIQAAKKTADLIPLCHPLPLDQVTVDFDFTPFPADFPAHSASRMPHSAFTSIRILVAARTTARTGVEMEAFTAVAVAALTIIDMLKAIDPAMQITGIRLLEKTGGKSHYKLK